MHWLGHEYKGILMAETEGEDALKSKTIFFNAWIDTDSDMITWS